MKDPPPFLTDALTAPSREPVKSISMHQSISLRGQVAVSKSDLIAYVSNVSACFDRRRDYVG